jgi:hypothetical protein
MKAVGIMSKTPSTFRKADIKRGVEALKSAGLKVARVEIDKSGKLIFISADGDVGGVATANEWDGAE